MNKLNEISTKFGRKKGLLHHVKADFQNRVGLFDSYININYSRVKRVVFVCKGNICRSPFGEFKARQMNIEAASAGISVNGPDAANELGCQTALVHGVDLAEHRSKSIYEIEIHQSDLLVAFEPWQAEWLTRLITEKGWGCQVTLLGLHLRNEFPHIEDPFGLSVEYFQTCYTRIVQGVESLAKKIFAEKSSKTVLVTEADTTGAVAVIRSLGRAGYKILATSKHGDAIGCKSNFVTESLLTPDYNSPQFIDWLRTIICDYRVQAIIPSESFLLAIKNNFEEFSSLIPFSTDKEVVYSGLSKCDLFTVVDEQNLPNYVVVDLENYSFTEIAKSVRTMHPPFYVKTDGLYAKTHGSGHVHEVTSIEKLSDILEEISSHYRKCLIQEYVPGSGVGVFFVIWEGKVLADFMHLRLHEVPYTGGVSSLRRSYFHQRIYDDALRKCMQMQWKGPVMIEYRYDKSTDTFSLVEMNGRFWGSLHLPLYAGVDFPKILLEMHFDNVVTPSTADWKNNTTISRQTFPLEIQHVWSVCKSTDLSILRKSRSIFKFVVDTLNPAVRSDYFSFKGDRYLLYYSASNLLKNIFRRGRRKQLVSNRSPEYMK